jgi:uncharacterized protein YtpQ (UPF0354 family)
VSGTSKESFAKQYIERLKARGWRSEAVYDSDRFAIVLADDAGTAFLDTVYKEWCNLPKSERSDHLDRAVAWLFEPQPSDDFVKVSSSILPVIRNRCQFDNQWRDDAEGMKEDFFAGVSKPFCDVMTIALAIDTPSAIQIVSAEVQSRWRRPFDEVLAIATENLRARSPSRFERTDGGFFVSTYEDYYDASRLLLPELFQELPLRGDPVAIAITRSGIVVAGSDDHDALDAMAAFVEAQLEQETRPISYLPLILRQGTWRPCDTDGVNSAAFDRLRARQDLWDYKVQKELLDAQFEGTGRDVFVATLNGVRDGGQIRTWTTWTGAAATLLPEADAVAMVRKSGDQTIVRFWGDIQQQCGPLKAEPNMYPPRYLVEVGPSVASWEHISRCEHPAWLPLRSRKG